MQARINHEVFDTLDVKLFNFGIKFFIALDSINQWLINDQSLQKGILELARYLLDLLVQFLYIYSKFIISLRTNIERAKIDMPKL